MTCVDEILSILLTSLVRKITLAATRHTLTTHQVASQPTRISSPNCVHNRV